MIFWSSVLNSCRVRSERVGSAHYHIGWCRQKYFEKTGSSTVCHIEYRHISFLALPFVITVIISRRAGPRGFNELFFTCGSYNLYHLTWCRHTWSLPTPMRDIQWQRQVDLSSSVIPPSSLNNSKETIHIPLIVFSILYGSHFGIAIFDHFLPSYNLTCRTYLKRLKC